MKTFRVVVVVEVSRVEAEDKLHAENLTLAWVRESLADNLFPGDSVRVTAVEQNAPSKTVKGVDGV